MKDKKNTEYLISLFLSIFASLIIGGFIMMANGRNPIVGYSSLINGAFGSKYNIATTLAKTVPVFLI